VDVEAIKGFSAISNDNPPTGDRVSFSLPSSELPELSTSPKGVVCTSNNGFSAITSEFFHESRVSLLLGVKSKRVKRLNKVLNDQYEYFLVLTNGGDYVSHAMSLYELSLVRLSHQSRVNFQVDRAPFTYTASMFSLVSNPSIASLFEVGSEAGLNFLLGGTVNGPALLASLAMFAQSTTSTMRATAVFSAVMAVGGPTCASQILSDCLMGLTGNIGSIADLASTFTMPGLEELSQASGMLLLLEGSLRSLARKAYGLLELPRVEIVQNLPSFIAQVLVSIPAMATAISEVASLCGMPFTGVVSPPMAIARKIRAMVQTKVGSSGLGFIPYRVAAIDYTNLCKEAEQAIFVATTAAAAQQRRDYTAVFLQSYLDQLKKWWTGATPPGESEVPAPIAWNIIGPAGCGKSTLHKRCAQIVISPFLRPDSGADGVIFKNGASDRFNDDVPPGSLALMIDDPILIAASLQDGGASGPINMYMEVAGGAPGALHAAAVEKKGKIFFRPVLVGMSFNEGFLVNSRHLVPEQDALNRRLGLLTRPKLKPEATTASGELDFAYFQKKEQEEGLFSALNDIWTFEVLTWSVSTKRWVAPDQTIYPGMHKTMRAGDFVVTLRRLVFERSLKTSRVHGNVTAMCGCGCAAPRDFCLRLGGISIEDQRELGTGGFTASAPPNNDLVGQHAADMLARWTNTEVAHWVADPPDPKYLPFLVLLDMIDQYAVRAFVLWMYVPVQAYIFHRMGELPAHWFFIFICFIQLFAAKAAYHNWTSAKASQWLSLGHTTRSVIIRTGIASLPSHSLLRYCVGVCGYTPLPLRAIKTAALLIGAAVALLAAYGAARVSSVALDSFMNCGRRAAPSMVPAGGTFSTAIGTRGRGPGLANVEPLDVLYPAKSDTVSINNATTTFGTMLVLVTLGDGSCTGFSTGESVCIVAHFAKRILESPQGIGMRVEYAQDTRYPPKEVVIYPSMVTMDCLNDIAIIDLRGELFKLKPTLCSLFPMEELRPNACTSFSVLTVVKFNKTTRQLVREITGPCLLKRGAPRYRLPGESTQCFGFGMACYWDCYYTSTAGDCGAFLLDEHSRVLGRLVASGNGVDEYKSIFAPIMPLARFSRVSEFQASCLLDGPPFKFSHLRNTGVAMLARQHVAPVASLGNAFETHAFETRLGPGAERVRAYAVERGLSLYGVPDTAWTPYAPADGGFANWELKALIKSKGIAPDIGHPDRVLIAKLMARHMVARSKIIYPEGFDILNQFTLASGGKACSPLKKGSSNGYGGPSGGHRALLEPNETGDGVRVIPEFWERMQNALVLADGHMMPQAVARASKKDEPREIGPDGAVKTARTIWVLNALSSFTERLFADFTTGASASLPGSRVGSNVFDPADAAEIAGAHLAAALFNGGRLFELDGVGMDSNQVRSTMREAIEGLAAVVKYRGAGPLWAERCKAVFAATLDCLWIVHNDVVLRERGLPSGSGVTTYTNTYGTCAVLSMCCLWAVAGCRENWTSLADVPFEDVGEEWLNQFLQTWIPSNVTGDDVSSPFSDSDVNRAAQMYGLLYENQYGSGVSIEPERVTFLRRTYVTRGTERVFAPLALESIVKMLMFETPTKDPAVQEGARRDRVISAHRELCLHGFEEYLKWEPILRHVWSTLDGAGSWTQEFEEDPWMAKPQSDD